MKHHPQEFISTVINSLAQFNSPNPANKLLKRRYLIMAKRIREAHETWQYLNIDDNFKRFMKEFLPYLKSNLKLIQVQDGKDSYQYYSCGTPHDPRNPAWRPFQIMETFCRKKKCDFEVVKSMIEDRLFKLKLKCECEILTNRNDIKRRELEAFGLDFSRSGRREFGIL
jgi:hypothetical protein